VHPLQKPNVYVKVNVYITNPPNTNPSNKWSGEDMPLLPAGKVDTTPQLLTIGTIAKTAGVTVRTLRYYEEIGLIAPEKRSDSQYRLYPDRVLRRIKAIFALQDLGYTLEQILVMLGPYNEVYTMTKVDKVNSTRSTLQQLLVCVEDKLTSLQAMQADLTHRMALLDNACTPCVGSQPALHCDIDCQHRDAHID
jgi:DNA-binding transcriptional MerR regulator